MQIIIQNLTCKSIIGILEHEREAPQSIKIDAKIDYDYDGKNFIDYAKLCAFMEDDLNQSCYLLLEDATQSLTQKIKSLYPDIEKIILKISKPDILPNAIVSVKLKVKFEKN